MTSFDYGNGVHICEKDIHKVTEKIVQVLKTELPEEAQCYTVIDSILDAAKQSIKCRKIVL